jgi:short-subunit dehydrogenase
VRITGHVAVVTGASSGIGASTAIDLARRGAKVVVVARREDRLKETLARCQEHSPASFAHAADVSSRAACEEIVAEAERQLGAVDILVNNAGISNHKHVSRTPVEEVERMMAVNFFGPVYLTMAALPGMLERRRGAIVNVTSVAGSVPNPGEAAYGASKAALGRWSHGLAVDLYGSGVHVGVLSPGPIDTEIWSHDEELVYEGKLYPPEVVAVAVAKMIETGATQVTVPRRYGAVGVLYPLLGRPMRWGMRKYEERAAAAKSAKDAKDAGHAKGAGS